MGVVVCMASPVSEIVGHQAERNLNLSCWAILTPSAAILTPLFSSSAHANASLNDNRRVSHGTWAEPLYINR